MSATPSRLDVDRIEDIDVHVGRPERADRGRLGGSITVVGEVDEGGVVHGVRGRRPVGRVDRVADLVRELDGERNLHVGGEVHDAGEQAAGVVAQGGGGGRAGAGA